MGEIMSWEILKAFREEAVLMALLGVFVGAYITYKLNILAERRKEETEKVNLINLLLLDMETLWSRYLQVLGKHIEKETNLDNPPMDLPIEQNYFTIFDSVASKVGLLENDTDSKTVEFYNYAKAYFLDTLKRYNELCKRLRELDLLRAGPQEYYKPIITTGIDERVEICLKQVQIAFKVVKVEHEELKKLYAETKNVLEMKRRRKCLF